MSEKLLATGGTREDQLISSTLRAAGLDAQVFAWSNFDALDQLDAVLIRSCWDYHLRPDVFRQWLDHLEARQIDIWNPPRLVRWNIDKRYLFDLEARGVRIVPSRLCENLERQTLIQLLADLKCSEMVIKPTIGATAFGCLRVSATSLEQCPAISPEEGPWLAQPFVPEIASEGEWSLLFFDSRFSHAVLKQAASGDYRVQSDFGGTANRGRPDEELIELGESCLKALETPPLYARVDIVRSATGPLLMELELIEPQLFLEPNDPALDVLVAKLSRSSVT